MTNVEPEAVVVDAAAERRQRDKLRKRAERAEEKRKKAAVEEAKKAEQYDDIQQFWDFNRARLTEEQRTAMEVRQLHLWDLMEAMQDYIDHTLDETGTTQADLDETIAEAQADVAQYGLCNSSVLSIPRIWSEEQADLRSHFSKPTLDLVTYGYFLAVTEREFETFRSKFLTKRVVIPKFTDVLTCAHCGGERVVRIETAEECRRQNRKFICELCSDSERRSASQANIRPQIVMGKETIVDGRGKARPDLSDPHYLLYGTGE